MGESGGIAEKEEVKDVVGSVSEEGGVSLLKLCGIAKVPTRARSSTVHKKSKSGQTVDEKVMNSAEDLVEVSSSDPKMGVVNSMENVVSDTVLVVQQETKNQSSPVFGTSGEYVKSTDVESLEQCAIQNHGKESPSDEHHHAIGVMQLNLTDEVMVDAEKPVDANESPRVETKDDSKMEEDKQQHMCASFKICDLNLMEGPEITEVPDDDPVVEDEKKALLDVGLSIGGNSSGNNGGNSGDKVIEVIDLEADDNPCDTSNEKGPLMYPSIESFLNNQVNPDGLPEIQDGYGLTIPEFLGNDANCSSVQTDINNLQPGMILPGGQVFPIPNVIPNDDSIYTSLGELPLNYMDMEVWDHPSLGYENNPSLEYEKFF
ncbi:Uncharacterized protein QJS10_CPA08g01923 [Acorus calamus]|uniref:Uncharacterized protein n=1 Tax=Acorus calamus TaxID=4465 RepID=A0AAV9EFZ9_ACOCL|nr:Uncharacterized protein QJS10_CPA08g01923 [Acorus calamus]